MTDFETRARAAGRAIRDAVHAPVDEVAPRRHGRGPVRALLAAAAVIVVTAIVGTTLAMRDEGAGPASDVPTFCAQVQRLVTTPVDVINGKRQSEGPSLDFLRDAPEEIRADAIEILRARERKASPNAEMAQRFTAWWQVHCYPQAAAPGAAPADQRYAPVPPPGPFAVCGASNGFGGPISPATRDRYGTIAIYGNATLADPYAAPMIGIIATREQVFFTDDHATPIDVAGHPGAQAIEATGPGGAAIPGLGQAVTWKDDRGDVTVIGRGWQPDRATELAALAATVTDGTDGPHLADSGTELRMLYRGPVADVYVRDAISLVSPTYVVTYRPDPESTATMTGDLSGSSALDAIRFFAPELTRREIAGKTVVTGVVPATNTVPGSVVRIASWREGDVRLTVRTSRDDLLATDATLAGLVGNTHRLDRSEWEALLTAGAACSSTESSSSASGSGSTSSESATSTTTSVVGP